MTEIEVGAWNSFVELIKKYLGNNKDDSYKYFTVFIILLASQSGLQHEY